MDTHTASDFLPPLHSDLSDFIAIRQAHGVYVDKTGPLERLLPPDIPGPGLRTGGAHLFTRPRRFGKTLLVSTMEAWFQGLPLCAAVQNSPD